MFENRKECSKTGNDVLKQERTFKTGKGHSKTGKDVIKQEIIPQYTLQMLTDKRQTN